MMESGFGNATRLTLSFMCLAQQAVLGIPSKHMLSPHVHIAQTILITLTRHASPLYACGPGDARGVHKTRLSSVCSWNRRFSKFTWDPSTPSKNTVQTMAAISTRSILSLSIH